jgi:hypothetical protein
VGDRSATEGIGYRLKRCDNGLNVSSGPNAPGFSSSNGRMGHNIAQLRAHPWGLAQQVLASLTAPDAAAVGLPRVGAKARQRELFRSDPERIMA